MIQKTAILTFPKTRLDQPVISRVIREYEVEVNILQAAITPEVDGRMIAIFSGAETAVKNALAYLKASDVRVILPTKNLIWHESKCVHCTACVGQCAPDAFTVDATTSQVEFHEKRCIACELCIPACSYGAIEPISDELVSNGD